MLFTNNEIYKHASNLMSVEFEERMPVRINFFLQKNIQKIINAGKEIENERMKIAQTFGSLNEESSGYIITQENMIMVEKELNDLLSLEQDLDIHIFDLDDFEGIELTTAQLSAIMFMIEE